MKEKSGFPLRIASAVRAGHESLLRLCVFLVAKVGAADRELQLISVEGRRPRRPCRGGPRRPTEYERQQRNSSIEVAMIVKRFAEHSLLIGSHATDHLRMIERAADEIRGIVERSASKESEAFLQCVAGLTSLNEQLDEVRVEIAAAGGRRRNMNA